MAEPESKSKRNSNSFGWLSRNPKSKKSNSFGWLSRNPKAEENSNSFGWLSRVTRTRWECFIIGPLRRGPTSLCDKKPRSSPSLALIDKRRLVTD